MPTNNPSGEMKRLTVWPHGVFLVFDKHSISPRFKVGRRVLDVVHIKLKPGLGHGNIVGPDVFAKT
jgi:hypothetical protein